jgi:2,2-dialkylglycine decarboxylase (pyruvate)
MGGELERSAKENLIRYGGDTFSEIVASAKGCHITTVSGRKILDFTSGQMCATIGHNHPAIVSAIQQSAETAIHLFGFFAICVGVALARQLTTTPDVVW